MPVIAEILELYPKFSYSNPNLLPEFMDSMWGKASLEPILLCYCYELSP